VKLQRFVWRRLTAILNMPEFFFHGSSSLSVPPVPILTLLPHVENSFLANQNAPPGERLTVIRFHNWRIVAIGYSRQPQNHGQCSTAVFAAKRAVSTLDGLLRRFHHPPPHYCYGGREVIPNPKAKLLDQVREVLRVKHYALRIEEVYVLWIKRFIFFHQKRHPRTSVLTFETFGCANKQIGDAGPTAHFQLFRYPFETDCCFFSQATRQLHLFRCSFPLGFQIRYLPANLGQSHSDEPMGLGFACFTPVTAIMIG
jgi:hypothetical protein